MLESKVNPRYHFDTTQWVVSLINTGRGMERIFSGHSKIIVEGQRLNPQTRSLELYVAECHIFATAHTDLNQTEQGLLPDWVRNALTNPRGVLTVLLTERNCYADEAREAQYRQADSQSWVRVPAQVSVMLNAIKEEKRRCEQGQNPAYQYRGDYFSGIQEEDIIVSLGVKKN